MFGRKKRIKALEESVSELAESYLQLKKENKSMRQELKRVGELAEETKLSTMRDYTRVYELILGMQKQSFEMNTANEAMLKGLEDLRSIVDEIRFLCEDAELSFEKEHGGDTEPGSEKKKAPVPLSVVFDEYLNGGHKDE